MDNDSLKTLQILDEISRDNQLTQRDLSTRLGVALGLTNLYLKRLVNKGFVKINYLQRNKRRIAYILTPHGLAEKSRLTIGYMQDSFRFYTGYRETLKKNFSVLLAAGVKEVALYDGGEMSEIAYVTLIELGIRPSLIVGPVTGRNFLGHPVEALDKLLQGSQKLVVSQPAMDDELRDFIEKQHLEERVFTLQYL